MAKRLNNLLRGQSAAFHCLYVNWKKLWHTLRQLSGDDAYERYLAHHTTCNADTAPLSRKEFFRHEQQQKWGEIKRCC